MAIKWGTPGAWTNSGIGTSAITTGSASTAGTGITNGTGLDLYADVTIRFSSFTPGTAPYVELHLLPLSSDGSTYADRSGTTRVASLVPTTGASAKTLVAIHILVPPGTFRWQIVNQAGATATPAADPQYRLYSLT
jgi:hypothetical protein